VFISQGHIVADGRPGEVAARFGRDDLEGVFLHLAEEREALAPEQRRRGA
jgi:ABC-2 type transport system ATP-binding protein